MPDAITRNPTIELGLFLILEGQIILNVLITEMKKCFLMIIGIWTFILLNNCMAQKDTIEINKLMSQFDEEFNSSPAKSLELGKKAKSLLSEAIPTRFYFRIYWWIGQAYTKLGDQKNALEYLNTSFKYISENDYKSKGEIYGALSRAYDITSDFKKVISCLLESVKFYEKAKISELRWSTKQNLAVCYAQTGNIDKATSYFFEVLKTQKKIGCEDHFIAESYINLGVIFGMKNNSDSSLLFYKEAYNILSKKGSSPSLAMVLNNMGAVSFKMENYKQGYIYLEEGLKTMIETGDKKGTALAQNNLANAYTGNNELKKALGFAKDAMSTSKAFNLMHEYKSACFNLAAIYNKLGDKDKAYNYCMRYAQLIDSLKDGEVHKQIAEMETKYETDKKQKEIEILSKDKQLNQAQLEQEKYLRYSLIGISSMIILIAVMLFFGLRSKQRVNQELDLKNAKIQQAYLLIEEKQKEILDSIHYARRIQKALITSEKYIERNLNKLNAK